MASSKRVALVGDLPPARASAAASSLCQFLVAAAQFGDLAGGGGAARFPARAFFGDGGQALRARLRLRASGLPARRALRRWRCALRRLRRAPRRRLAVSATPSPSASSSASGCGADSSAASRRLCQGGGFPLPARRAARRARRRRARRACLRPGRRSALCSVLRSSCFGRAADFARGIGGILGRGLVRKRPARTSLRLRGFLFQRGEAVALRQAHGGRRGRIGGSGIAVPAPQIAARRDQTLARLQAASAAPRPDRERPVRSWQAARQARPAP